MMDLRGRKIPVFLEEIDSFIKSENLNGTSIEKSPCMTIRGGFIQCNRCGGIKEKREFKLPNGCFYCPDCTQLGRISSNQVFLHEATPKMLPALDVHMTWKGALTSEQKRCSRKVVQAVLRRETLLLHAVTGAGKTEILFKGIEAALKQGLRICIAVPRIDVLLELKPRIQDAFQSIDLCCLYGKSDEVYRLTPLILLTTHQLARFHQAFDVCIVDEVDAFPFVDNPFLEFSLQQAKKTESALIYLSATPGRIAKKTGHRTVDRVVTLPARFHQHSLVTPSFVFTPDWRRQIQEKKLPKKFGHSVQQMMEDGFPFLIFYPVIRDLDNLAEILSNEFPTLRLETVSSIDEQRIEKIEDFRIGKMDCLVTTTILERGVTFPDISVLVLGSDHPLFTKSVLIQIAGRSGRKLTRPDGVVRFFYDQKTKAMIESKKEIRVLNHLARQRGLLVDSFKLASNRRNPVF
ncbi:MAG: DEAD/DEAH box helicase family protein [Streptococcaceae bacterium]|nr:DEAD/DEAH box helicase family protein [Streptococcaceae bacterium]